MCYVLTDNQYFIGKDFRGRPIAVTSVQKAYTFKTQAAAGNFLKCIPDSIRLYSWKICDCGEDNGVYEPKKYGNPTKPTDLENDEFDICAFFTNVIEIMSQLDRFIFNMTDNEELTNMKILDIRHYIRDNNHKLSAIQMQRLGYYLQDLEKERYSYKSKRLIASMFTENINALKDKDNIRKMNDILNSQYRPRVLDDTDIAYIINKKKDAEPLLPPLCDIRDTL